ncbi:hypothetical protein PA01_10150 [Azoarcus sp. PA01]|nr:hypothetical protein PA01_10150 [Azoarcus sp. PA01]
MSKETSAKDPLEFVRGMWSSMGFSLPGMVTPTLDVDELDKRIADLKAVENWLKMNLNMLQMTIQGLEMQRVAIATMQAMTQQAREATENPAQQGDNPFAAAAMWPWNLMSGAPPAADAPSPTSDQKKTEPKPSGGAAAKSTPPPK